MKASGRRHGTKHAAASRLRKVVPFVSLCGVLWGVYASYSIGTAVHVDAELELTLQQLQVLQSDHVSSTNTPKTPTTTTFRPPSSMSGHRYPDRSSKFLPRSSQGRVMDLDDPALLRDSGWDASPIILEDFHLCFWTTPKVGTTVFKQLFRRMMGKADWLLDKDPNIPHNPKWNGLRYLYDFSPDQVEEILTSPRWTRAIFVRDPLERVLSAYLDKAVRQNGSYVKRHCCGIKPFKKAVVHSADNDKPQEQRREALRHAQQRAAIAMEDYGRKQRRLQAFSPQYMGSLQSQMRLRVSQIASRAKLAGSVPHGMPLPSTCQNISAYSTETISFETFVHDFLWTCTTDPHWKLQSSQMEERVWNHVNFVGRFSDLARDTRRLLQRVSAWDVYGAKEWPPSGGGIFSNNTASHKTSSRIAYEQYYSSLSLKRAVLDLYANDYEHPVLNLTRPQ